MCIDRRFVGVTFLFLAACTSGSSPTVSTPVPPASQGYVPVPTISGIVWDGAMPIQGAQIDNGYGPGSWVFSDANGGFQLSTNKSIDPHAWVRATKAGYLQPCAAPITASGPVAVQLVSLAALTSAPVDSLPGFRTISGVVMMTTGAGAQPAAGAWVDFEPSSVDDWPAAVTHTDSSGKFSLCTLPETTVIIGALVGNAYTYVAVPPGQATIELTIDPIGVEGRHR